MKLAIMQPYLFPYLGYFQLIKSVDKFVIYDDVNFIKQGWINRNRILLRDVAHTFTVPLSKGSSFSKINETKVHDVLYEKWKKNFLITVKESYKKAPHFEETFPLVSSVFDGRVSYISDLARRSIFETARFLEIDTEFNASSAIYNNNHLNAQDRVLDICKIEGAQSYINPANGKELYSKEDFIANGFQLNFIQPRLSPYKQFGHSFLEGLSIIDVLMFNEKARVQDFLYQYALD